MARPDPDQLLRQVQAEEQCWQRGRLKVFLGYAKGVGKTFRMLDEGRRRRERGEDVVVGAVQPTVPPEIQALLERMEIIPPLTINGISVMDVRAILQRHPQVCLVDGLAYDNPPGSANPTRWQDVEELLAAGISVIASVNLQHIDEHREEVERITGKHVSETVPQSFLSTADEIEIVDASPEMCIERRATEVNDHDGASAMPEQQLSELREIALVLAADVVDRQLQLYLERHGIHQSWGTQERILVCVTPQKDAIKMLESGRRNADRFHGELFVAYVRSPNLTAEEQVALERNLSVARELGAQVEALEGEEPVDTLLRFARDRGITQIFTGHSARESWPEKIFGGPVDRLIRAAEGIDVRVFPQ